MQPNQPHTDYDFIMNPGNGAKKVPLGGNSMASRIMVVVGGLFLLIIIASIAISFLGNTGKAFNEGAMLGAAQSQSELSRLGALGAQDGVSQSTKNFSLTLKLGMQSEQQKLLAYLATEGFEPDPKELLLKQDVQVDSQLADAKSSSTFDATYKTTMQRELKSYQTDLTAAYEGANEAAKKVLSENFKVANLLLTQLESTD